jgi:L-2-hydroxyglutarate oxidase
MSPDVIVIGAGIVGLATALRLLTTRPSTRLVLLEKESGLARHQTGNNSGVIHSGLYYRPGSRKAENCREGYRELLAFCEKEGIPHEICGKVVIATSADELPRLQTLHQRGIENGLSGLRMLSPEEIREIEPHCSGIRGLWVPQTGIVDYSAVSETYALRIRELGGEILFGQRVESIRRREGGVEVAGTDRSWAARVLVACAGLHSDRLARLTHPDLPLRITPFRGEYYVLNPDACGLVRNLIYPVPDPAFPFLGVHFTRRINGGVECGPNAVLAFGREAYGKWQFHLGETLETLRWPGFRIVARKYWRMGLGEFRRSFSKAAFVRALQRLVPEIRPEHLAPGGAGIRAQACSVDGQLLDDFDIRSDGPVIHVCNAPSPAATASLAIGNTIARTVLEHLGSGMQACGGSTTGS